MKKLIDYVPDDVLEWEEARKLVEVFSEAQLVYDVEAEKIEEVIDFFRETEPRVLRRVLEDIGGITAVTGMPNNVLLNCIIFASKMWRSKGTYASVEYLAKMFYGDAILDDSNLVSENFIVLDDFALGYLPDGYDIGKYLSNNLDGKPQYPYACVDSVIGARNHKYAYYNPVIQTTASLPLAVHYTPQVVVNNQTLTFPTCNTSMLMLLGDFSDYVGSIELRFIGEYFSAKEARRFVVRMLPYILPFASFESTNITVKFYNHTHNVRRGVWDDSIALDFSRAYSFTQRPEIDLYL